MNKINNYNFLMLNKNPNFKKKIPMNISIIKNNVIRFMRISNIQNNILFSNKHLIINAQKQVIFSRINRINRINNKNINRIEIRNSNIKINNIKNIVLKEDNKIEKKISETNNITYDVEKFKKNKIVDINKNNEIENIINNISLNKIIELHKIDNYKDNYLEYVIDKKIVNSFIYELLYKYIIVK